QYKPDYYVDYLEDSPWIHQPMEKYESMSVTDLL
ncbi:MAG: phosphoribosyltransferase, partial [SAR324 cluster bacterium]|nr:phosphoribosyltransferase [SAR324 cluster bacterium]